VIGAILGLIFLFPILLLIGTIIRLDSRGPALFWQTRVGRGGQNFRMLKFRTMQVGTESAVEESIHSTPDYLISPQQYYKILNDPRLTRLGSFLRRSSIDELPQLWNVLRGEMSLVGPRPFLPHQRAYYGDKYFDYIRVRPGMTGLWQVSGRSRLSFIERVELDACYLHSWSLCLDLSILARTIWVVVHGEGAY
jgi:lipopolysaccharide/colanic/teichoic acid biosynthesis glycosyltransferase